LPRVSKKDEKLLGDLKNPLAGTFYLEFQKIENSSYKISSELMKRMVDKGEETNKVPLLILDFKGFTLKAIITKKEICK
jgi:hypothetical protein